ncbi:MAG: glycosyl transferase, partial [Deltaproteobacteria bacterium]
MNFQSKVQIQPATHAARQFLATWLTRSGGELWQDARPIRSELFGVERLEHHALTLAVAQPVNLGAPKRVPPLSRRLKANKALLSDAYAKLAKGLQDGQVVTPAAEWLLDNFHLVEQQLRQITEDLPPGYYRQLPKLADGPFQGYPRVFGLAWNFVAHTDSLISETALTKFVQAYQRVEPLMIGELWAVAISLRIVLIENMRRLAELVIEGLTLRARADALVDDVIGAGGKTRVPLHVAIAPYDESELPEIMAAQIAKRLRGFDPSDTPLLGWLVDHLSRRGMTLEEVVQNRQTRQGATNVTMRNIVTSMRLVSETDWPDFVESVSLVDDKLASDPTFRAMDFATRNQYRTAIENLARGSDFTELEVADQALAAGDEPGQVLIGEGRSDFEATLTFEPPLRVQLTRMIKSAGLRGYLGSVVVLSALLLIAVLPGFASAGFLPLLVLGLLVLPLASEVSTAITNLIVMRFIGPDLIASIDLEKGVPDDLRTLVVVPVLLSNTDELDEQLERLEVHHLSSVSGAVHYVLLSDGPDSKCGVNDADAPLITRALDGIARLNAKYPTRQNNRFILLHRHRLWNASQGRWMGWERKRGKLVELNRLLRGDKTTSFMVLDGHAPKVPANVRYVITLDADTELERDTVHRLIGKMAHPLNTPRFDAETGLITGGYGILQPRVSPSLPSDQNGSLYARIFSSPGGIDPYAAASSDIYQDIFGEGSFTGKGIYDVDAFMRALDGRVPDNAMLSHDLFEGTFARAGLASDVEVVEEFPARYDVDTRRQHRWVRGDWQLLPWIFGVRGQSLPPLGRAKMLDNLRRSTLAPTTLAALFAGWLLTPALALSWTITVLVVMALPFLLSLPFAIVPGRAGITSHSHFAALAADTKAAFGRIGMGIALVPYSAWQMIDAISRTLIRVFVTKRNLLEWMTAAQSGKGGLGSPVRQYLRMAGGSILGLAACAFAIFLNPAVWPIVMPFLALL